MRNGWMRFMWPTWPTVGFSAASPLRTRLPPWRPPIQCRPRRSRFSSKRLWTVTCRMGLGRRLPALEEIEEVRAVLGAREAVAERLLGEHLRELGPRSCRWRSVACSGTSSTNTCATGLPSGASNGTACLRRTKAPRASFNPLMRPWGMAMPCPSPVDPSFSRAARLAAIAPASSLPWVANSAPTASNRRAFDGTSRSRTMFEGVSSSAIWFTGESLLL